MTQIERKQEIARKTEPEPVSRWRKVKLPAPICRIIHYIYKFLEHTDPTARPRHFLLRIVHYFRRLADAYITHQVGLMACACAYCAVLSLVPLILVCVAIFGFFLGGKAQALDKTIEAIHLYIPAFNPTFLKEQLNTVIDSSRVMGLFGLTFLIYGAHQTFLAMQPAMNLIWVVAETRHWIKQRLIALAATFFTLLLLPATIAATALTVRVAESTSHWLKSDVQALVLQLLTGLLPILVTTLLFMVLYCLLPDRRVPWRAAFLGAFVGAILWELTKVGFAFYLLKTQSHNGYTLIYGSLSSLVVIVVWMYYSMAILLIGAEVAADYEFMRQGRKAAEARSHSGADLTAATRDGNYQRERAAQAARHMKIYGIGVDMHNEEVSPPALPNPDPDPELYE